MDVQLQSPPPTYGLGRLHSKTAVGHGRIVLLLAAPKNGGITVGRLRTNWALDAYNPPGTVASLKAKRP